MCVCQLFRVIFLYVRANILGDLGKFYTTTVLILVSSEDNEVLMESIASVHGNSQ